MPTLSISSSIPKSSSFVNENNFNTEDILKDQTIKPPAKNLKKNNITDLNLKDILPIVWLLGTLALTFYYTVLNLLFWFRIRRFNRTTNNNINNLLALCRSEMGISKKMKVYTNEKITTPMWFGLIRPRILIPQHIIEIFSQRQLKHILLHELAHYKRFDLQLNLLSLILHVLHWFNPIIWYGFIKMRNDREAACDEFVLNHIGKQNTDDYGQTLISLLRKPARAKWSPVMIGLMDNHSNLKRRIFMITKFKERSNVWGILACFIFISISITLFTDVSNSTEQNITPNSSQHEEKISSEKNNEIKIGPMLANGKLKAFRRGNKWGFMNTEDDTLFIPTFDQIYQYAKTGNIPVKLNGKWGFISSSGNLIVNTIYAEFHDYTREGYAAVKLGTKWGYIDKDGQYLFTPQFDDAQSFKDNFAAVKIRSKWGFVDTRGDIIINPQFDLVFGFTNQAAPVMENKRWGFVNSNGDVIVKPKFESVTFFSSGLAAVKKNGRWGYIDELGNLVIKCKFDLAEKFSNGFAAVLIGSKWGYISQAGTIVITPKYDNTYPFYNGRAMVEKNGKFGYIDENGEIIVPLESDFLTAARKFNN